MVALALGVVVMLPVGAGRAVVVRVFVIALCVFVILRGGAVVGVEDAELGLDVDVLAPPLALVHLRILLPPPLALVQLRILRSSTSLMIAALGAVSAALAALTEINRPARLQTIIDYQAAMEAAGNGTDDVNAQLGVGGLLLRRVSRWGGLPAPRHDAGHCAPPARMGGYFRSALHYRTIVLSTRKLQFFQRFISVKDEIKAC